MLVIQPKIYMIFVSMKKAIVAATLFLGLSIVHAQTEKPKGFENSSHELISGTNIKLLPASKLSIDPEVPKTETPKITLKFDIPEYVWNTKKLIQNIDPDKIKEKSSDSIFLSNYIRLGGGNNTHFQGEVYLSNKPNAQWAYYFNANHIQANNSDIDQKFSNTKVQLGGSRFYKNSSLSSSLFYHFDKTSFYAKDSTLRLPDFQNSGQGKIGLNGKNSNTYGVNIDYVSLASGKKPEFKLLNRISQFQTNLLHNELELGSTLKVLKNFKNLSVFGDIEFTQIKSTQTHNFEGTEKYKTELSQYFVDIKPRVQFYHKATDLDVNLGINATINNNKNQPDRTFVINPTIQLEKGLKGLEMKVYGAIDGGLIKNSIRRMNDVMPFFADTLSLKNTYQQLNGYLGIKGKIAGNSQFSIDFGSNSMADMLQFVTDTSKNNLDSLNLLKPMYLNSVSSVYFRAFMQYHMGETFKLSANLRINQFDVKNQTLYNIPSLTYNVTAEYLPHSNVLIKIGMQGIGRRNERNGDYRGFNDLFARIDYRFNGKGRIWIQGSNLLNQEYDTWYGYKAFGLTVVGGISLAIF